MMNRRGQFFADARVRAVVTGAAMLTFNACVACGGESGSPVESAASSATSMVTDSSPVSAAEVEYLDCVELLLGGIMFIVDPVNGGGWQSRSGQVTDDLIRLYGTESTQYTVHLFTLQSGHLRTLMEMAASEGVVAAAADARRYSAAACSEAYGFVPTDDPDPAGNTSTLTTDDLIKRCGEMVYTTLVEAFREQHDGNVDNAGNARTLLVRDFGIDSPEYAVYEALTFEVLEQGRLHGESAASREALRADEECSRVYRTEDAPPVATDVPASATSPISIVEPPKSSIGQAVPGVVGSDDNAAWWLGAPSRAPEFLEGVNARWRSGEVPEPYASCVLPGSLSPPGEWGSDGKVSLERESEGWGLRWPGELGQHILVLTADDVNSNPHYKATSQTPGTYAAGATHWATPAYSMLHFDNDPCWYLWGISDDAPMGAIRAFYSGMGFMEQAVSGTASTVGAEATQSPCPVGGVDVLEQGDGVGEGCPSVRQAQAWLSRFIDLDIDGQFGPGMAEAVRQFQTQSGLEVDGLIGPKTWSALEESEFWDN